MDVETIVVGAGVVGLACAAALARRGHEVILVESSGMIGSGTSSRNSEVIHAGIYYPLNSLKHLLCVAGRRRLYPYLETRGVAHKKCGKLIVATSQEEDASILALLERGRANDVENLAFLSGAEAKALEPNLHATSAILSTETGILDSHGLMLALQGELEDHGGVVVFNTPFEGAEVLATGGFSCRFGGEEEMRLTCANLVNSGGLYAHEISARVHGYDTSLAPPFYLAKGSYFSCRTPSAFGRLIYPAPVDGGLGVHVTLDLNGQMRFGPDVEWLDNKNPDEVDYRVDLTRAQGFYRAIRTYFPDLPANAIQADYAGCRPKLSWKGEPAADFRVDGPSVHGIEGLVHLFGIESPGLTSSLALADLVAARLADDADPY
jgi:L-2-hydroxyglutarate oxidase LhgO